MWKQQQQQQQLEEAFVVPPPLTQPIPQVTRLAPTCIEERKKCQDHIEAACSGKNLPSSWNGHKNLEMKAVNALLISSALRVFGRKREKEKRGIKEGEMDIKEERDVKKI
ncbi:hypothetical protein F2P81_004128 [Scophthalmus maximus]|uniref:Uncharacterized protein n=1 Tax=Scophthalmus maximus TaxID=52904 RepID=A0A6A4TIU3_SCOMX|nr:hypothetical protein F2P81_004128 [Scophthalmus maximus]